MNINENFRNKRKMVDNLKGCAYNEPVCQLLCILDFHNWKQMKVES